jgi:secretion/DNA translocation related TadE-like protein
MCPKAWALVWFQTTGPESRRAALLADRGSGTILAIGLIFAILGIMALVLAVGYQSLEANRLQATADAAAIAGDDALRGLNTGFACQVAEVMVQSAGATLDRCRIVETDIYISVCQRYMGLTLEANSRAGRN